MTNQANWQQMIGILFWQALMLGILISSALWFKSEAEPLPVNTSTIISATADCEKPDATRKTRTAGGRLFDIGLATR